MSKLSREINAGAKKAIADHGGWLMGVTGLVAENLDPEKQHRVKVLIPSIDEALVFDEWARQMVFCLGNGFGSAFVPPKGSEVVLFGQLGQKFNLFYIPLYNEEMLMPDGFTDENSVGFRAPKNFTVITIELLKGIARNIEFAAEQLVKITGQNIESLAGSLNKTTGQNIESLADSLNKTTGQNVESTADQLNKVAGNEVQLQGSTITVNGNGTISIQGGNVTVTGSSIKLHGRTVNPVGPSI